MIDEITGLDMPDGPYSKLYMITEHTEYGPTILQTAIVLRGSKASARAYIAWHQRFYLGVLDWEEV